MYFRNKNCSKRGNKRAASTHSSHSNKENFNQPKREEQQNVSNNKTFSFPDGGWV